MHSSDEACVLSCADKEAIMNEHELNDLHIDMAQKRLSSQYPNVSRLQKTLYQYKQPLECMILFTIPLTKIPMTL